MVAYRLCPELQLGKANLVLRAIILQVREIFAGTPQGDFQSLNTGLQFGTANAELQHT